MKKILFLLFAGILSSAAVSAQAKAETTTTVQQKRTDNAQVATDYSNMIAKELGLTDAQRKQVYDARFNMLNKKQRLDSAYGADSRKTNPDAYTAVENDFIGIMKTILTAEQYAKWEANKSLR
jgi:Spy/CpxP family protein refolding chaperone